MSEERAVKVRRSILCWIALAPLVVVNLFPFAVMLATAVKPQKELFAYPPTWLPSVARWWNFVEMWTQTNFGQALVNSLMVSVLSTALTIACGAPAAYAMLRSRMTFVRGYRRFLLITQMVSPIVLVVGLFRLFVQFGVVDTYLPLVLTYAAFNMAFAILMLEGYFLAIPREIEEAAWMDGAGPLYTIVRIFLPIALPAVTIVAIFTFINVWNDFVIALTLLRSEANYTLPIKVFSLASNQYWIAWHYTMGAALLATIPITVLFCCVQRYLHGNIMQGAIR